jgi:transposase
MADSLARAVRAMRAYERARKARDAAIRDAVADGHSQRAVAKAVGFTHTRVQQLLRSE